MAITQISINQLQPDLSQISELGKQIFDQTNNVNGENTVLDWQPRLAATLSLLCKNEGVSYQPRFMLLKAPESFLFTNLLCQSVNKSLPDPKLGYSYYINENQIVLNSAKNRQDNFAIQARCLTALNVDSETLFGCVRQPENAPIRLQAGLVHQANDGVLILGLRSLLNQPTLFAKLKEMVLKRVFTWTSPDDTHPLPFSIPALPLDLRIIFVGDRISLAELEELDPEFYAASLYTEFENELHITSTKQITDWANYLNFITQTQQLPPISSSAFALLFKQAIRYTGDHYYLPLSIDWIQSLLANAALFADSNNIDETALMQAIEQKSWRENYLLECFHNEFLNNQILINTRDSIVGQINGLTVVEYPGYPKAIGEATRLSCLVYFGDGEFIDIERKTELAGNIHSKGMMIMQSFILSELSLNYPLPFSTSMVFEQSYNEIDGDSASLAGLCVLLSALAGQPIDQQLAVTGSVDQFGNVQSIGGVTTKIEGFFAICKQQGLTGQQGVIIPASNLRHLCLNDEVTEAINNNQFSIWTVEHVSEAIYLLMGLPYKSDSQLNLYKLIQMRINTFHQQDKKKETWFSRLRQYGKKN